MKRNKFSLSHYRLMSMNMGPLVPCGLVEVLPGDTFQHNTNMLIRLSPLVAPVMHPCHVRIHHWFVPHRLVWPVTDSDGGWENFITGGKDGMNTANVPTIDIGLDAVANAEGNLADYFGIPIDIGKTFKVSALPFRGYNLIYNEWYRDQDLSPERAKEQTDLAFPAWEKDYFTTARPWTQKGPTVTIPVEGQAPVLGLGVGSGATPGTGGTYTQADGTTATYPFAYATGTAIRANTNTANSPPEVFADMQNVTAASINDLRLAFALQRYEEARARWGSRYTEYLRYLGVRSSDARLQRPEYLGGGKQTIQFSEVLQTGGDAAGEPTGVGNLKGHGIAAARSNRYRRFFEEHGYVFSFISVKPRTVYAQSVNRTWLRQVKEDFFQKELQHIGQQEVWTGELYAKAAQERGTFGYQDRYDEYRRQESNVAGQFRTTLDYWHMARIFASEPVLNDSFVRANPTNRIFADQTSSDNQLLIMASHSIQARRMVAKSGTSFIF